MKKHGIFLILMVIFSFIPSHYQTSPLPRILCNFFLHSKKSERRLSERLKTHYNPLDIFWINFVKTVKLILTYITHSLILHLRVGILWSLCEIMVFTILCCFSSLFKSSSYFVANSGWPLSYCVDQAGLQLMKIHLTLHP